MSRKGQFKKGGGRVGGATKSHSKKKHRKSPSSSAMTVSSTRTVYVKPAKRKGGKRRSNSGGGMPKLLHLAGAAAALAYVCTPGKGPAMVTNYATKIPGAATFGAPAAVGIVALGIDRFVKRNKWLKLLGAAGIVLAASRVGTAGTDFKFVGDADDVGDSDDYTGDLDDVGDDDDDDDVGDYDE